MSHIEEALAVLRQHLGPAGLMGASHVAPALTVEQARALVEALSAPSRPAKVCAGESCPCGPLTFNSHAASLPRPATGWVAPSEVERRVAEAVSAAKAEEREACERECDEAAEDFDASVKLCGPLNAKKAEGARECRDRIRARGASTATPAPESCGRRGCKAEAVTPFEETSLGSGLCSVHFDELSEATSQGLEAYRSGRLCAHGYRSECPFMCEHYPENANDTPASPRGSDRTGGSIGAPAPEGCGCSMNRAEAEFLKDWASGRSLFGGNWARLTEALRRAIELNAMDRSKVYEVRLLVGAAPEGDEDEDSGCPRCCGDGADLLTGRQACDLCSGTGRAAPEQKEGKA